MRQGDEPGASFMTAPGVFFRESRDKVYGLSNIFLWFYVKLRALGSACFKQKLEQNALQAVKVM